MMTAIAVRDSVPEDVEFMFEVYQASIGPYVVQTWGRRDEAFLKERFQRPLLDVPHRIIEANGQPVGLLAVKESAQFIFLHRIFLLPQAQKRGMGTRLIREILQSAQKRGLPVRLRVLKVNPARALYERLGFAVIEETETHYLMETGFPTPVAS